MELQLSYDDLWPFYMDFHGIYAQLDCSSAHTQHSHRNAQRIANVFVVAAAAKFVRCQCARNERYVPNINKSASKHVYTTLH